MNSNCRALVFVQHLLMLQILNFSLGQHRESCFTSIMDGSTTQKKLFIKTKKKVQLQMSFAIMILLHGQHPSTSELYISAKSKRFALLKDQRSPCIFQNICSRQMQRSRQFCGKRMKLLNQINSTFLGLI